MDLNDSGKTSSSNEHSLNAFSPNSTIPLKSTDVKFAPPLSKALFPMIWAFGKLKVFILTVNFAPLNAWFAIFVTLEISNTSKPWELLFPAFRKQKLPSSFTPESLTSSRLFSPENAYAGNAFVSSPVSVYIFVCSKSTVNLFRFRNLTLWSVTPPSQTRSLYSRFPFVMLRLSTFFGVILFLSTISCMLFPVYDWSSIVTPISNLSSGTSLTAYVVISRAFAYWFSGSCPEPDE